MCTPLVGRILDLVSKPATAAGQELYMHPHLTLVYLDQQRRHLATTAERHRISQDAPRRPARAARPAKARTEWRWLKLPHFATVH